MAKCHKVAEIIHLQKLEDSILDLKYKLVNSIEKKAAILYLLR